MWFSRIAGLLFRLRVRKRIVIVVAVIAALLIAGVVYQNLSSAANERANPPLGPSSIWEAVDYISAAPARGRLQSF